MKRALFTLALVLVGCQDMQAVMTVRLEPALVGRVSRVESLVTDATWREPDDEGRLVSEGATKLSHGYSFGALASNDVVRIRFRAYSSDPVTPLLEQRFEQRLKEGEKSAFSVTLSERCVDFHCPPGTACPSAEPPSCVEVAQMVSPTPVVPMDGAVPTLLDAGVPANETSTTPQPPEVCGCSDLHVLPPLCNVGMCSGVCAQHWGDCDRDLAKTGCEADLSQPEHCGICTTSCEFGVCRDFACVQEPFGGVKGTWEVTWHANRMYGLMLPIPYDGKVIGLGLHLNTGGPHPDSHFLLALYRSTPEQAPGDVLTSTGELSTDSRDWEMLGVERVYGGLEQRTHPVDVREGEQVWFFFVSDGPLDILTTKDVFKSYQQTAKETSYAGLHQKVPDSLQGVSLVDGGSHETVDAYFIMAPDLER